MENLRQMVQTVCQALQASFGETLDGRTEAEKFLRSFEASAGFPEILMRLIGDENIDHSVRLAAAILLKNEIRKFWTTSSVFALKEDEERQEYSAADKEFVRHHIVQLMLSVATHTSLRNMVNEQIRVLIMTDFPKPWKNIAVEVEKCVSQRDNRNNLFCGLLLLRSLFIRFEYKVEEEERVALEDLTSVFYPILLTLVVDLQRNSGDIFNSKDDSILLRQVLKIYWVSTQTALAKDSVVVSTLNSWMEILRHTIKTPVPHCFLEECANNAEALQDLPMMKCKKLAVQIFHRFMSRHASSTSKLENELNGRDQAIGKVLNSQWTPVMVVDIVEVLREEAEGQQALAPRVRNLALQTLTRSLELSSTYRLIKPHLHFVLTRICFPLFCYDKADIEQWHEDPVQYIRERAEYSPCDAREAAVELLKTACRIRGKDWLEPVTTFVHEILLSHQNATEEERKTELNCKKDGALLMISSVAERLTTKKRQLQVEPFLMNYVLPEMDATDPFLRMRACSTIERFLDLEITDNTYVVKNKNNMIMLFEKMVARMADEELPVRAQAATSVRCFFAHESIKTVVTQKLSEVISKLFRLMSELDNDQIVDTLEAMVMNYQEEIPPFACELVSFLSNNFMRMLDSQHERNNDEQDIFLTSLNTTQTIISVLESLSQSELVEPWNAMQVTLLPILERILTPDMLDHFEDGIAIACYLTFYPPKILKEMWIIYERCYSAVCGGDFSHLVLGEVFKDGWAVDYLDRMIPVIDNFMTRDKETFLTGYGVLSDGTPVPYSEMVIAIIKKLLLPELNFATDIPKTALELLALMFEGFVDDRRIDHFILSSLELVWGHYQQHQHEGEGATRKQMLLSNAEPLRFGKSTRAMIIRVFCSMMLYNMEGFMKIVQEQGISDLVFRMITSGLGSLRSVEGKKIFVLAFCHVLQTFDAACIPDVLRSNKPEIAKAVAEQFSGYIIKKRQQEEENSSCGDGDSEQELDEHQDADASPQQALLPRLRHLAFNDVDNDSDQDSDETYEATTDERLRRSPLDKINEYEVVLRTIDMSHEAFVQSMGVDGVRQLREQLKLAAGFDQPSG